MGKIELGEPGFEGQILEYDDKYSGKNFHDQDLSDRVDLKGITIFGSNFYSETPDIKIFPDGMKDVKFVNCNLDNVVIPSGNIIQNCSTRRFKVQNDGNDWEVDLNNSPIKPLNSWVFTKFNLPIPEPKDIPVEKTAGPIDLMAVARIKKESDGN